VVLAALALTLTVGACSAAGASSHAPAASPGSSATLIAFVMVMDGGTGAAIEVSGPDQIGRLVGGPPAAIESARAAVAGHSGADTRLFAFVLAGCQNDGAALAIYAGRITATLTGGKGYACFVAQWYLAVFAVPASLVPPGTRVG
jgi:hypothetical protein